MKAKKLICAVLTTALSAAILAGCGGNAGKQSGNNSSTVPAPNGNSVSSSVSSSGTGWSKTITLSNGKTYPSGTISIICPYSAGGGTDLGIRLFAQYAQQYTDATIIVENIEGGNGLVGIQTGMSRGTDGSTIWHMDTGPQYVTTEVSACPFNVLEEMSLIGQIVGDDRVWIARTDEARFASGQELLEYAKAHPGEINCGVSGTGVISGLSTVYISNVTGAELNVIGYNGASDAKAAFLGGHCDIMAAGVSEAAPMLAEGQCKVLLSLTDERIYDDVATVKELGYDAVSVSTDRGLAMHGQTDPAIVQYWNDIMDMVCADPAFVEDAAKQSLTIHHRDSEEFTDQFAALYDIWYDLKVTLGQ